MGVTSCSVVGDKGSVCAACADGVLLASCKPGCVKTWSKFGNNRPLEESIKMLINTSKMIIPAKEARVCCRDIGCETGGFTSSSRSAGSVIC